jgi:hypothetical protein
MVEHYSNIDLVFRNGLKEFEILPPEDVWEGVVPSVKRTKSSPVWLQAAAIATIILTSGILAYSIAHTLSGTFSGPAITLNQDSRPEGRYTPYIRNVKPAIPVTVATSDISTETASLAENISPSVDYTLPGAVNLKGLGTPQDQLSSRNNLLFFSNKSVRPDPVIPYTKDITAGYYAPRDEITSARKNRWSIGAMVSPTYYSMFEGSNSDPANNLASSENAVMSYSGGLSFAYSVNKRISLQMGLYYSSLNHEINGVQTYSGFAPLNTMKSSGNFSVQTANGTIISRNNDIFLANTRSSDRVKSEFLSEAFNPAKAGLDYVSSSVYQNFNYLEVPFIVRYKVIDKTLGMNVVGGISYNQLLSNSAYAVSDGNKYFIGSTDGLYPITLSSSIGVGMEYSLSKKLSINLEPTFRYYLTPMSGQGGSSLHPYTFGIFSGVSFKF